MKINKRGIEPVVATVLLIVITIVLVALVVSFVVPWLQTQIKTTDMCYSTKLEIKELCYNEAGETTPANVLIRIARGADSVDITKITIGISNATGTKTDSRIDVPKQLEETVYYVPVIGTPTSAKIAATVKSGTTEISCDYSQEKAIPACA